MANLTAQAKSTKTAKTRVDSRICTKRLANPWESESYDDVLHAIKSGNILPYTAWTWIGGSSTQV